MANLPQFLRFDCAKFNYRTPNIGYVTAPIAKKCQSVINYLQEMKLNDANLINFICGIDKNNPSYFSDHSQLLDHFQNKLLPICGTSRGFKFEIYLFSDGVSYINLIAKILQMPQIECCSNVEIILNGRSLYPMQFPIESISNWLHRNCDGIEEKSKERFLRIFSFSFLCARELELCDHLKKVIIVITE